MRLLFAVSFIVMSVSMAQVYLRQSFGDGNTPIASIDKPNDLFTYTFQAQADHIKSLVRNFFVLFSYDIFGESSHARSL